LQTSASWQPKGRSQNVLPLAEFCVANHVSTAKLPRNRGEPRHSQIKSGQSPNPVNASHIISLNPQSLALKGKTKDFSIANETRSQQSLLTTSAVSHMFTFRSLLKARRCSLLRGYLSLHSIIWSYNCELPCRQWEIRGMTVSGSCQASRPRGFPLWRQCALSK
jgi:hypothetical protein